MNKELAQAKKKRDEVIARGHATKAETLDLLETLELAAMQTWPGRPENDRFRDIKASLGEEVPVSFFAALYSDLDMLATEYRINS